MMQTKNAKKYLLVGLLASILVGLAEWLLHFTPEPIIGELSMLFDVPLERARWGHYLAILSAPLYFVGYYGIYIAFRLMHPVLARLILMLGIFAFAVGGMWLSSRYFGAVVIQNTDGDLQEYFISQYENHYQIIVWLLRVLILMISIIYVLLIIKSRAILPWFYALLNPVFILIFVISWLFWLNPVGQHLSPIAMNTTHFIWFSVLLYISPRLSMSNE